MGRLHSPGKGISSSTIPYRRSAPHWLQLTSENCVQMICDYARKGVRPSQIGLSLEIAMVLAWSALSRAPNLTASFVLMAFLHNFQKNFTISSEKQSTLESTLNVTITISIQSTALFLSNQESTGLLVTIRHVESLHPTGSTTPRQPLLSLHK